MDSKNQSYLNDQEPHSGNDESSTDDGFHSDSENREVRQRLGREIYKNYKPLAVPTSEDLAICWKAIDDDASPNDKFAMKVLLCEIRDGRRLASLLLHVMPTLSRRWYEEDYWREFVIPLGATLPQKDSNGCNACHHVFLGRLSSTRTSTQDHVTANTFLEAVYEQDRDKINETTGEIFKSRTYLHLAADAASSGYFIKTVDRLLEMGADASKTDDDGNTAWESAFANNDISVMNKLYAVHEDATVKNTDQAKRHWLRIHKVSLAAKGPVLVKYDGPLANLKKRQDQLFIVAANKLSLNRLSGLLCKC